MFISICLPALAIGALIHEIAADMTGYRSSNSTSTTSYVSEPAQYTTYYVKASPASPETSNYEDFVYEHKGTPLSVADDPGLCSALQSSAGSGEVVFKVWTNNIAELADRFRHDPGIDGFDIITEDAVEKKQSENSTDFWNHY
jgi:hypothetical protein